VTTIRRDLDWLGAPIRMTDHLRSGDYSRYREWYHSSFRI
jgi:hypothetical protein